MIVSIGDLPTHRSYCALNHVPTSYELQAQEICIVGRTRAVFEGGLKIRQLLVGCETHSLVAHIEADVLSGYQHDMVAIMGAARCVLSQYGEIAYMKPIGIGGRQLKVTFISEQSADAALRAYPVGPWSSLWAPPEIQREGNLVQVSPRTMNCSGIPFESLF